MRILVTNDDGIEAPGIKTLALFALNLGADVTVAAPSGPMSGKSQSLNLREPFGARRTDTFAGAECWAVDSTPADCVRFALYAIEKQFDLVLSGINSGYNIGRDIDYSGTAGAVFEASRCGLKAAAFSAPSKYQEKASLFLPAAWDFISEHRLFEKHGLLNVNLPPDARGVRITHQGGDHGVNTYTFGEDGICRPTLIGVPLPVDDISLDTGAVRNGYISITPLTTDRTSDIYRDLARELNKD